MVEIVCHVLSSDEIFAPFFKEARASRISSRIIEAIEAFKQTRAMITLKLKQSITDCHASQVRAQLVDIY